jgi:hypothetical protein
MKMHKKNFLAAVPVAFLVVGLAACGGHSSTSGQKSENAQQSQDTTNLESSQPLPTVYYSQERANLEDIELAEVNDVRTTSFVLGNNGDVLIYSCPSIGFGIPDSASLSNPEQVVGLGNYNAVTTGQMDPTGIYAPASSAGTWLICLTASGQPYINRFEPNVSTIGGPASWVQAPKNGQHIVSTGAPTALGTTVDNKKAAVDKR